MGIHHDRHYFTSVTVPIKDLEVSVAEGTTEAAIETEPTTVESEPTTVESEPTIVESEPTIVESEPNTNESEPNTVKARTFNGYDESNGKPGYGDSYEEPGHDAA